jgi:hypothetical protein
VTHKCEEACSDCMSIPPCMFSNVRIPCEACNRNFRSQTCFDRQKTNKLRGRTVCERKKNCATCGSLLTRKKHECFKPFCTYCKENREIGHFCFMKPLKNELHSSDDVLFVFYDFESTQDSKISDSATVHIPNLVCLQQFYTHCETQTNIDIDCKRCGKRKHSLFDDPVGDLSYLCEARPWCKNIIVNS